MAGRDEVNHPCFQKRLRKREAEEVLEYVKTIKLGRLAVNYDEIDKYLTRFPYFSKYAQQVRKQLVSLGTLRVVKRNEVIFMQGDPSPNIYFILRGTVKLSVKKSDMGNQPVIIKTIYDGQEFGEQVHLKESEHLTREVIE